MCFNMFMLQNRIEKQVSGVKIGNCDGDFSS